MSSTKPAPEVTESLEREIVEDTNKWLIADSSHSNKMLHVPNGNGAPMCRDDEYRTNEYFTTDSHNMKFLQKEHPIYPIGYREVCSDCGMLWKLHNE